MVRATDGSGLRKRQRGFAAVPNETVFDAGLSARALGVLTKLIALPEDWDLRRDWLIRQFPEGRDAITTAVRELRRAGFYRVERRRRDDGTFTTGVSVSDVALPEWTEQHLAACAAQGTDRPKFDVSLRVLPDGRLEDEPIAGPPQVEELPFGTLGDESDTPTADGKPVSGKPVSGSPVTGSPAINTQTYTQTITQGGAAEGSSYVSSPPALEPPPASAAAAASPAPPGEDLEPAEHCADWPHPPRSCPPCGDARRQHQVWAGRQLERSRARDAGEREVARRRRELADAELAGCRLCDEAGLLPSGERCLHDPDLNPGRGRAEFQAALAALPEPPAPRAARRAAADRHAT